MAKEDETPFPKAKWKKVITNEHLLPLLKIMRNLTEVSALTVREKQDMIFTIDELIDRMPDEDN